MPRDFLVHKSRSTPANTRTSAVKSKTTYDVYNILGLIHFNGILKLFNMHKNLTHKITPLYPIFLP